jgi:hypothetical protein
MPWLEIWEQAANRSLFTPAERRRYFCEHNVAGLLRGDLDSRYRAYATGRQWGWLSVDDIRRLENMNAIGQKAGGDVYLVPLNMADAKWLADGSMQPNKPGTPDPTGTLSPLDAEAKEGHSAESGNHGAGRYEPQLIHKLLPRGRRINAPKTLQIGGQVC